MAVSRFWGNVPTAEFTPMSFQELAAGPQFMYQKEQELSAKVDAMNEAQATLKAALGDHAPKMDEFEIQSQELANRISKEGATPRNIDLGKKLRQQFIETITPIEDFARKRETYAQEYYKAAADKNNIIIGQNPLAPTFDQFKKDPNSLQFSTIGRDKLASFGIKYGDEIRRSLTKEYSDPKTGLWHRQTGMISEEEAFNKFNNDPQFRSLIEAQADKVAAANGLPLDHKEARDAIIGGILSATVGQDEIRNMPQGVVTGGGTSLQMPSLVTSYVSKMKPSSFYDDALQIKANPRLKSSADAQVRELTKGRFNTYDELDKAIENEFPTEKEKTSSAANVTSRFGSIEAGESGVLMPTRPIWGKSENAKIRDIIIQNLRDSGSFKQTINISPNWTSAHNLGDEKMTKHIQGYQVNLGKDLADQIMALPSDNKDWGGVEKDDRDVIGNGERDGTFMSKKSGDRFAQVNAIKINAATGEPVLEVLLEWSDANGKKAPAKPVMVRVPPEFIYKTLNVFDETLGGKNSSDPNIRGARQLIDNWYNVVRPNLDKLTQPQ